MRRLTRNRLIVTWALLSHLMAALFVHVPMAYATSADATETAASQPCHEHMGHASHVGSAAQMSGMQTGSGSDHASGCHSGFCKCACAHGQALAVMPTLVAPPLLRSPSLSRYRIPVAPESATSFFRPPI